MGEQDMTSYFLSPDMFDLSAEPGEAVAADDRTPTDAERVLWQGHAAVAEFGLSDGELAPPRWVLPEATEVTITDRRVVYTHVVRGPGVWPPYPPSSPQAASSAVDEVTSG